MSSSPSSLTRRKVILDCDVGIDDAVALALLVQSEKIQLLAVTTNTGNVSIEKTTRNALDVLSLLDEQSIPVAKGVARPAFTVLLENYSKIHGVNGIGGVELPTSEQLVDERHAIEVFAELLEEEPAKSVSIAVVGPLTNFAMFMKTYPALVDKIDRLIVMGGTTSNGNITPVSEFNIWSDPLSAKYVFDNVSCPTSMVGLDVTRLATVNEEELTRWSRNTQWGSTIAQMVRGYLDINSNGWPMHDALAVSILIDESVLAFENARIYVYTDDDENYARTYCDFTQEAVSSGPQISVALGVDLRKFKDLLTELM
jgi:pyrimidine-specific ribonucleoside hydrolase